MLKANELILAVRIENYIQFSFLIYIFEFVFNQNGRKRIEKYFDISAEKNDVSHKLCSTHIF